MKKTYFLTGSQNLYDQDVLDQVAANSKSMADFFNSKLGDLVTIEWMTTVISSDMILDACQRASVDPDCVGVITWMHTFSPAKMWIKGLQILTKPLLHLHTQFNEKLPYDTIDMDFMNLNQSAHGDREFGFICARLGIPRQIVAGHYKHEDVIGRIRQFVEVSKAINYSKNLKVAMFGNNMREVAVTDGDRVESQIKYGWEVNFYPTGDLADIVKTVTDEEIDAKISEYEGLYDFEKDDYTLASIKHQAAYEVALDKFIVEGGFGAYTDTFQDLHGLEQLPGLATQRMQGKGVGFGAEGDYKTAAMNAVMNEMASSRVGGTGFMEDYTYDLTQGEELILGAHMLEVSPVFAASKPKIEVHPLSIGDKDDPARLVFDGIKGDGVLVCMVDFGNRFRLICAKVELVNQPFPMPKLPVARLMWKPVPDFKTGAQAWIEAGGGHHMVLSTAVNVEDMKLFAKLTKTELAVIDDKGLQILKV